MSYPRQVFVPVALAETEKIKHSNLINALEQNNENLFCEILSNEKDACNEKGWNNMTPLHQCCLRGHLKFIRILIQHKADLNAVTNYGETPLHYACRRGDIEIIHFLIKSGCDINLIDKSGRNCMHFAATGGSVLALHYLGTQTLLQYDGVTHEGNSPLHICCLQQHQHAVYYLLRRERSNLWQQNQSGETVLHVAVKLGNSELIWKILQVAGCGLIHVKNQNGNTAVDEALQQSSERHKVIAKDLKYYSKQNSKNPPKGPIVTWYTMLLLPFVLLGIVFLLSSYLNHNSGHFSVLVIILILVYVGRQSHRISHPSKWANPMYVGLFVAATNHCTIASYVKIFPNILPNYVLLITVTFLSITAYRSFYVLILGNSGVVTQSKSINGRKLNVLDIAMGRCKAQDFCPYTELIKPENGKYCKICEKMVENLDHHCLFLYNCIAKLNHRRFVLFIILVMVMQILFCIEVGIYITKIHSKISFENFFYKEPWLFGLVLLCSLTFIWEFTLVLSQLANIALNQTAYYSHRRLSQLSTKEALLNICNFLMARKSTERNFTFHDSKLAV